MSSPDTVELPEPPSSSPAMPLLRRLPALASRAWRDFAFLITGFVTGTAIFCIAITLVSLSAGLLVLIIGVPVAMLSSEILRWCADVERLRALIVDPKPVRAAYRSLPKSLLPMARTMISDRRRWQDVVYHVVQFPIAVVGFCVATVSWAVALGALTYPLYFWALPQGPRHSGTNIDGFYVDTFPKSLVLMALGLIAVPIAFALCRLMVQVALTAIRVLLGDDLDRLQARVSHLETTRAGAVDAQSSELRRIERDLHDGAQARMVAVAMDLGMAEERMANDPEGARELIQGARGEARRALAEMRDLVRGIAPSVLADRGLDAALSSLIARSPVPVLLDIELEQRPPSSAETAAYFVVSEALVNVAKHATASSCEVTVRGDESELRIRVEDDGAGDAKILPGGGLAGLHDRVAAVDGALTVTSPTGGPTIIEARIPCAS